MGNRCCEKGKTLLQLAAVIVIFFFTDSVSYEIFSLIFSLCGDGIVALTMRLCLDILDVWAAVYLYADYVLKKPLSQLYLGKPLLTLRWCVAAVLLPAAIDGFYLLFVKGNLQSGHLTQEKQIYILFSDIFVFGFRRAVMDGMIFRGLALGIFLERFGRRGGSFLSGIVYAAAVLLLKAPLLWNGEGLLLLFVTAFLTGTALALVTCESGSVWASVTIDALYHAFCADSHILHIDTEQSFPAVFTYTIEEESWLGVWMTGTFGLLAALPVMAGFLAVSFLAVWSMKVTDAHTGVLLKASAASPGRAEHMGSNFLQDSLTGKMLRNLFKGLAAGVYLTGLLYFGGKNMMQQYFFASYTGETALVKDLEEYAKQHHTKAADAKQLLSWAEDKGIYEFMTARDGWLVFDAAYPGEILSGSRKMPGTVWRPYYRVTFADGDADVYISTGFDDTYYRILLGVCVLAGFAACLGTVICGMQENAAYIQCLERQVNAIGKGNLEETVTVKGKDELGRLALGLDEMRRQLYEKEQTEKEMRRAQEKLVLGMSHDLRTPLTGLLAYMEVLKKQEREGRPCREYIDKAYGKILQIRHLSDQMFEYFFLESCQGAVLEPAEELASALGDYLSELCAMLECSGFYVNVQLLEWKPVFVRVNTDYLGRILNNIYSNLEKYAGREKEVLLWISYEKDRAGIVIQNSAAVPKQYGQGTGIGVKNISFMMEQMGGMAQEKIMGEKYQIVLYFPVYEK